MKRGRAAAAALAAALTVLPGAAPALADPSIRWAPATPQEQQPGVSLLWARWAGGAEQTCTAFPLSLTPGARSDKMATSAHCLAPEGSSSYPGRVDIIPPSLPGQPGRSCQATSMEVPQKWFSVRGKVDDDRYDYEKLTVDCTLPGAFGLTGTVPPQGTAAPVYGFPGLDGKERQWRLWGTVTEPLPTVDLLSPDLPQITVNGDRRVQGMSGSPWVDPKNPGFAFGIMSGTEDGGTTFASPALTCEVREWLLPGSCPK